MSASNLSISAPDLVIGYRHRASSPSYPSSATDSADHQLEGAKDLLLTDQLTFELFVGIFRRWHSAVDDHPLGQPDRGLAIAVLSDDVFDMGQAMAGRILDALGPSRPRLLDLAPHLPFDGEMVVPFDGEMVGFGIDAPNLDHAVASAICHFPSPTPFAL